MSANDIDSLYDNARAEARASGSSGDFLLYKASPGQWFTGIFVAYEERTAPFGEVTMGRFVRVRTEAGDFPAEDTKTWDIIDHVAKLELLPDELRPEGPESRNPRPEPGSVVFVEYQGKRTGKSGKAYNGYLIKVTPPTDETRAIAKAAEESTGSAGGGGGASAIGSDEIPFHHSEV